MGVKNIYIMSKKTNIERLVAEYTLVAKKHTTDVSALNNGKVITSMDAYHVLRQIIGDSMEINEVFCMLMLNQNNMIIGYAVIGVGGQTSCVVDPKMVFRQALIHNAAALILCHNHPSGNLNASVEDQKITKKLQSAAQLLDLKILDHIIATNTNYFSFADNGQM